MRTGKRFTLSSSLSPSLTFTNRNSKFTATVRIYFTDSQLPEMRGLSRRQRRAVRRGGFEIFCQEQPSRKLQVLAFNNAILFFAILLARGFQPKSGYSWWLGPFVAAVVTLSVGLIWHSFLTERLRPYFRRFLDNPDREFKELV